MNAIRERQTYTHSAIMQLRDFDRDHPHFTDETKDRITLVADTLSRLENAEEVQRYHLTDALEVVCGPKQIVYCPVCRAYYLTHLATGFTGYCGTIGCGREMILLKVV